MNRPTLFRKLISQSARGRHVKDVKDQEDLFTSDYQIACYVPTKKTMSIKPSTVSVLANRSLNQNQRVPWNGGPKGLSTEFVYRLSRFSLSPRPVHRLQKIFPSISNKFETLLKI